MSKFLIAKLCLAGVSKLIFFIYILWSIDVEITYRHLLVKKYLIRIRKSYVSCKYKSYYDAKREKNMTNEVNNLVILTPPPLYSFSLYVLDKTTSYIGKKSFIPIGKFFLK